MIKKTGVAGFGTMGQGIAITFAMHGYPVHVFDVDKQRLENARTEIEKELVFLAQESLLENASLDGILNNIHTFDTLEECVADLDYMIEAAPEDLSLKQRLLQQLDQLCPAKTILASNTSSLPLKGMMALLTDQRKVMTLVNHWYNPAHLIPVIEISDFGNTSRDIYETVASFYKSIGKQPVRVLKDVPGLVANRIQQAVAREVFSLIETGVATAEDIDNALKFGPAFRYATTGQLEIADFGGLDIWSITGDNLLRVMDNSQQANRLLKQKVGEGKLGFKTGEGFYTYDPGGKEAVKRAYYKKLICQLKASSNYIR